MPLPFDRVASSYDATRGGTERGRWMAAALRPWVDDTARVVEVGVGTGLVAGALLADEVDVVGIDLSLPMLQLAFPRLPGRVAAGDANRLPIRSGSASTVFYVHVLHLVDDMRTVFAEANRVMAAGGRVLATCGASTAVPRDDIGRVVSRIGHLIDAFRGDEPDAVVSAAHACGLRTVHRDELVHARDFTPLEVAALLEGRSLSWTWDIDGERWQREVVPVIDALRALPQPDRPRQRYDERTLFVFSR